MTAGLRRNFDDYAAFHRTPGNKACHSLGIPIILLASLALFARVPLFAAFGAQLARFALTLRSHAVEHRLPGLGGKFRPPDADIDDLDTE